MTPSMRRRYPNLSRRSMAWDVVGLAAVVAIIGLVWWATS